jgi:membrane protein
MSINTRGALVRTYHDVVKNQTFQAAAALSYYTILCIFPALILLSAIMAHIPLPHFFQDSLVAMARVLPPGTMPAVNAVLQDILTASSGAWLSLGTLGTLWVVSSAFDEMIEALDTAYDVVDHRSFWRIRFLALALAAIVTVFLICALATMILGREIGDWVAVRLSFTRVFFLLWRYLHWSIAVSFTVLAVACIYFLAPNVRQRFRATMPGAVCSVTCWMGLSYLLGIYFRYFANYNRTYGTLAGVMGLMTWLYWAYFILLAGGELNAELAKARKSSPSTAEPHRAASLSVVKSKHVRPQDSR